MKKYWAGIHVVVEKNGKYLIMKRTLTDEHAPGCWDLPGGSIMLGEQPYDAAIRETREEAGIDINNIRLMDVFAFEFDDLWSVELIAEARYVSGEVKLSQEHFEYQWLSKRKIIQLKSGSVQIKQLIKQFKKN